MASRYKATGCARFFFFLLFFIPLVYFGLQFLNDNGKLEEWKDKINLDNDKSAVEEVLEKKNDSEFDLVAIKRQLVELLAKIETQDQIIKDQEVTIKNLETLVENLKTGKNTNTEEAVKTNTSTAKKGDLSLEDLLKEADKALKKEN